MTSRRPRLAARLPGVLLLVALLLSAGRAETDGARELLDEAARRNGLASWRDRTLELTIESLSGESQTRVREARVSERNDPDGGHRTLIEFVGPADVEGVLYLHLAPRGGDEQEWVYAPQARRPRRITPGQSDETATGAELGYRKIEALTWLLASPAADLDATLAGDETLDGRPCRVVRLTPREAGAQAYDLWLGTEDLLPCALVPRGAEGRTARQVRFSGYEKIDGHATPLLVEVEGPDGAWRTIFRLRDVRYDVGLGDGVFSLARLNRGR